MMDIKAIKERLPHRFPFLLIDRVEELEVGKYIKGYKNVSVNEPFFNGHFPDYPIMPGVLIIEALAQAAGVLGFMTLDKTPDQGSVYMFVGVDGMRFKRQVVPGDRLTLEATVIAEKRGIWKFAVKASVDGELAASGEILVAEREVHP